MNPPNLCTQQLVEPYTPKKMKSFYLDVDPQGVSKRPQNGKYSWANWISNFAYYINATKRGYWPPRSPGVKSVLDSEIKDHLKWEGWNGINNIFSRLPEKHTSNGAWKKKRQLSTIYSSCGLADAVARIKIENKCINF